jgi:hypothetical protein
MCKLFSFILSLPACDITTMNNFVSCFRHYATVVVVVVVILKSEDERSKLTRDCDFE